MVIRAGWGNTGRALLELADVGIDRETKSSVSKAASKALAEKSFASGRVKGEDIKVLEVQGIKAGQSYLVDVELAVPESLTVGETRPIEDLVRKGLGANVRGIRRVKVKFVAESSDALDLADEFVAAEANTTEILEAETDEHSHSHDHSHDSHHHDRQRKGNGHSTGVDIRL